MRSGSTVPGLSWPVLLLLALVAVGCSKDSKSPVSIDPVLSEGTSLESVNGGFTTARENPGFGDPFLLHSEVEENEVLDPMGQNPHVRDLMGRSDVTLYALTIMWGSLRTPDTTGTREDGTTFTWDGNVSAKGGLVILNSLISFEPQDGDQLLPRISPSEVAWVSHTGLGYDGVRVTILRNPSAVHGSGKDSLTVTLGSFRRTYVFEALDSLAEMVDLDGLGNSISLRGFIADPTANRLRGFLRGTWTAIALGDSVGNFQGVWVTQQGRFDGFYRGIYGTRADGRRVFLGKIIDGAGDFRGFLRGTWDPIPNSTDPSRGKVGRFTGGWVDEAEVHHGSLRGTWRLPPGRVGFMDGRWCEGCPPDTVEVGL